MRVRKLRGNFVKKCKIRSFRLKVILVKTLGM